jgi:hypothetical protein
MKFLTAVLMVLLGTAWLACSESGGSATDAAGDSATNAEAGVDKGQVFDQTPDAVDAGGEADGTDDTRVDGAEDSGDDGGEGYYTLPQGCGYPDRSFDCNPFNNDPCDESKGEKCDGNILFGFNCYPAPNTIPEYDICDATIGCQVGLTCMRESDYAQEGECRKICCIDDDCDSTEYCKPFEDFYGTFGWCADNP